MHPFRQGEERHAAIGAINMDICIEDINAKIKRCTRCRLSKTRIHALCGEGTLSAKLMLIAQAPGETEDKSGTMFIGPSGKVLDELLEMAHIMAFQYRPNQNFANYTGRLLRLTTNEYCHCIILLLSSMMHRLKRYW